MKINLELKVLNHVPLRPEVAAAILKQFIAEISTDGYIFDEPLKGKDLRLGVISGGGIVISRIKEININEMMGYIFIDDSGSKRYYSLGTFTEISWGPY